jgi:hypothetical protein
MKLESRCSLVLLVALAMGCGGSEGTENTPPAVDDVVVNNVIPNEAARGRQVSVRILGRGFDEGSTVSFTDGEAPTESITASGVQFVSARELQANLEIRAGSPAKRYTVRIRTGRGTRGTGNEKFEVLALEILGDGIATAVNRLETVVGNASPPGGGPGTAFVREAGGPLTTLPPVVDFGGGQARDITDNDLIVGSSDGRPVRWLPGPARKPEELFPRQTTRWTAIGGRANSANEAGLIVGYVQLGDTANFDAFCWRQGAWTVLVAEDTSYDRSGVLLDLNEVGDAVGRVPQRIGPLPSVGIWRPLLVHCHAEQPVAIILPTPTDTTSSEATAIADDGTVYGGMLTTSGWVTVRWRQTARDQWGSPEIVQLPFQVNAVTAGGRAVGSALTSNSVSIAYLWDPSAGVLALSGPAEGISGVLGAVDNGPGSQLTLVGFAFGTEPGVGRKAVIWPAPIFVP